jgi:hypothetical protein
MPGILVANRLRLHARIAVVDGEVQRHHTIAPRCVLFREGGSVC